MVIYRCTTKDSAAGTVVYIKLGALCSRIKYKQLIQIKLRRNVRIKTFIFYCTNIHMLHLIKIYIECSFLTIVYSKKVCIETYLVLLNPDE
jgi:hypothetical protein